MRILGVLVLVAMLSGCHAAKSSKNFAPYDCTSAVCTMAADTSNNSADGD